MGTPKTDTQNEDVMGARLGDVISLLEEAPLENVHAILDIGAGKGELAKIFARQGKKVTCTGVQVKSYIADVQALKEEHGIEYVECDVEHMPFPDGSFDAVVMCHVLEHCPDVSSALKHARRVLRDDGWLFIFLPPQEDEVCAGHVSVGWNIGQLMYTLLLNGFNIQTGRFIEFGYNVCGFVKRTERCLPNLRFDSGDIANLGEKGYLPLPLVTKSSGGDHFWGSVRAINWPNISKYRIGRNHRILRVVFGLLDSLLPKAITFHLGRFLKRIGRLLILLSTENPDRLV